MHWVTASLRKSKWAHLAEGIDLKAFLSPINRPWGVHRFYDEGHDLAALGKLPSRHHENGKAYDFFGWDNPLFQRAGIIAPSVNKRGETKLTARNSHQTRRAMADVLAQKLGLPAKAVAEAA